MLMFQLIIVALSAHADPGNPYTVNGVCINHHVKCGCPATPPCKGVEHMLFLDEPSWGRSSLEDHPWSDNHWGSGDGMGSGGDDEGPAQGPGYIGASSSFEGDSHDSQKAQAPATDPNSSPDPAPAPDPGRSTSLVDFGVDSAPSTPRAQPLEAPLALPEATFVQTDIPL